MRSVGIHLNVYVACSHKRSHKSIHKTGWQHTIPPLCEKLKNSHRAENFPTIFVRRGGGVQIRSSYCRCEPRHRNYAHTRRKCGGGRGGTRPLRNASVLEVYLERFVLGSTLIFTSVTVPYFSK